MALRPWHSSSNRGANPKEPGLQPRRAGRGNVFGGSSKKIYLLQRPKPPVSAFRHGREWQKRRRLIIRRSRRQTREAASGSRIRLRGKQFDSIADLNAYRAAPTGGARTDTPLKKAQQVAYDAMEASGQRRGWNLPDTRLRSHGTAPMPGCSWPMQRMTLKEHWSMPARLRPRGSGCSERSISRTRPGTSGC